MSIPTWSKSLVMLLCLFAGTFTLTGCGGGPSDGDVADGEVTESEEPTLTEEEAANEPTEY